MQENRKNTQRERLLAGMVEIAAQEGYASASIAQVIAHAGVSRATFYEYFTDRDDCFLASVEHAHQVLAADVRTAVADAEPHRGSHAVTGALVAFACAQPALARVVMNETMAGGPRALHARDTGIIQLERLIEPAYKQLAPDTPLPDLSSRMLIGGVYRLLASRLRRKQLSLDELPHDLTRWIESYEQPLSEHRWRNLTPAPPVASSPYVPQDPLYPPDAIPPGRSRLSKEQIAENHRQRILFATAAATMRSGYAATKVTDITTIAGVDGRRFYALFADKQEAFMAIHELGFQQTMAVTAAAFFAGANWPERVWEGGRASTQFLQNNPTIAHIGFVESYAVGAAAVQRIEDARTAFTIFLQEGYQHKPNKHPPTPHDQSPSPLALEAIAATNFEIAYHEARKRPDPKMTGLLPHITHLALTPFTGPHAANQLIDEQATKHALAEPPSIESPKRRRRAIIQAPGPRVGDPGAWDISYPERL